jgi:hypothetical protein
MPEPRRQRQRAAALLQPEDILGLTHLQRVVVVTRIDESFGCLIQLTPHNAQATQEKKVVLGAEVNREKPQLSASFGLCKLVAEEMDVGVGGNQRAQEI